MDVHAARRVRLVEQPGEVETLGFPVLHDMPLVEHLHLADHLGEAAIAHLRHQLAHFLGDEEEVVDDMLGLADETLAQHRVLGGDADRAGVEVAHPHHDAASRNQGRGGEAELVGAEERAHDDVASGAQTAIDLHGNAAAQAICHQGLMGFSKTNFPRRARMLDRGERRSAGAALESGNGDMIGARLGHAGGNGADTDFRDELDRDETAGIDVLEIEDELREVLNRIDVVMGWRRDQGHTRRGVAHLGDGLVDLVTGKLTTLAGLCTLGHLDLHHVGIDEVFGRHAEAPGGNLLDRGARGVPIGKRLVAVRLLAAFAGVGFAANAIHGHSKRGVRLA